MKPILVLVEWEDASATDNAVWISRDGTAPEAKVVIFQQVGWLMEHTAAHVLLSSALSDDFMAARDRIPLGMVRKIVGLAAGRKLSLKPKSKG